MMEMFVVYERPRDYPDKFVLRRWSIGPGSAEGDADWFVLGETLDDVRAAVPQHCIRVGRSPHDEPQIVESWV